jgi:hypothetical protein
MIDERDLIEDLGQTRGHNAKTIGIDDVSGLP